MKLLIISKDPFDDGGGGDDDDDGGDVNDEGNGGKSPAVLFTSITVNKQTGIQKIFLRNVTVNYSDV